MTTGDPSVVLYDDREIRRKVPSRLGSVGGDIVGPIRRSLGGEGL